jgi:hypothetical protein
MRHAQHRREHDPDRDPFLVRVHRVVPAAQRTSERRDREGRVERDLRERRSDADRAKKRRPQAPEDLQAGHQTILAERIRHEIDGVAEIREGADTMIFAEGRASRLEERLRRDRPDVHADGIAQLS